MKRFLTFIIMLFMMIISVSYAQNQWARPSELKVDYQQQEMKGEGYLILDDYTQSFINVIDNNFNNKATFHLYSICDINNYPYPYITKEDEHLGAITIKDSPYLMVINLQDETHVILSIYKGIGERYDLSGIPFYRTHQLVDEFHSVGITEDEVAKMIIRYLTKLR